MPVPEPDWPALRRARDLQRRDGRLLICSIRTMQGLLLRHDTAWNWPARARPYDWAVQGV